MLRDPGDLHNMNHQVPAQCCLAGKSGLASLIIVEPLPCQCPEFHPHRLRGLFSSLPFAQLMFVCSQQQVHAAAKQTHPAGPSGLGGCVSPSRLCLRQRGRCPCGVPCSQGGPALVPSRCWCGCPGYIWSTGSVSPWSGTHSSSHSTGRTQGSRWVGGRRGTQVGVGGLHGDGAETRQMTEYCCSLC